MGGFSWVTARRYAVALLIGALFGAGSASGAAAHDDQGSYGGVRFRVPLSGQEEVPPADADGRGIAWIKVKPSHDRFCYALSVARIDGDITAAHLHQAPAGVNGPIVIPLEPPFDGSSAACVTIDHDLAVAIVTDPEGFYVNVHSTVFPDGAVRGQLP